MKLSQFLNTRELFRQFENYNHYYTEQILMCESLFNQSQYLLSISSSEDVHYVQLNHNLYGASILYYKNKKNRKNRTILHQIISLLGVSHVLDIDKISNEDVLKLLNILNAQYADTTLN